MSLDLRTALVRAADRPAYDLDLATIERRGGRLRRNRRVVVVVAGAAVVASGWNVAAGLGDFGGPDTPPGGSRPSTNAPAIGDSAASFALHALMDAGLMDPVGVNYGYDGLERAGTSWMVSLHRSECEPDGGSCSPSPGRHEMMIRRDGGEFIIESVRGTFLQDEAHRLIGRRGPVRREPQMRFYSVVVRPSVEGGPAVVSSFFWDGPLPTRLVQSCRLQLLREGRVVWEDELVAEKPHPSVRYASRFQEIPDHVRPTSARYRCDEPRPARRLTDRPSLRRIGPRVPIAAGAIAGGPWKLYIFRSNRGPCYDLDLGEDVSGRIACAGVPIQEPVSWRAMGGPIVWGLLRPEVARFEAEAPNRSATVVRIVRPPRGFGVRDSFFVAYAPRPGTRLVALDAAGRVLQRVRVLPPP